MEATTKIVDKAILVQYAALPLPSVETVVTWFREAGRLQLDTDDSDGRMPL